MVGHLAVMVRFLEAVWRRNLLCWLIYSLLSVLYFVGFKRLILLQLVLGLAVRVVALVGDQAAGTVNYASKLAH